MQYIPHIHTHLNTSKGELSGSLSSGHMDEEREIGERGERREEEEEEEEGGGEGEGEEGGEGEGGGLYDASPVYGVCMCV